MPTAREPISPVGLPAPAGLPDLPDLAGLHRDVLAWYSDHQRDLPWRDPGCSPWGVLLSEVMAQQTPIARVLPAWLDWMQRWPTPAALAAASPGDAVRAWGRLGYPRRALRLHECAVELTDRFGGQVPRSEAELRSLPGIGEYTAAAVACFAYGERTVVIDTNVRRVQARVVTGVAYPAASLTRVERELAAALVPRDRADAAVWNVAAMELGALICTARVARCADCPIRARCAWFAAGRPEHDGPPRRGQAWHGTDRQARGALLQALRDAPGAVRHTDLAAAWPTDDLQRERALDGLVADGLVEPLPRRRYRLPA